MKLQNAQWIAGDQICESPLFRQEFVAENIVHAEIEICGLGFFELYLNGHKVSEDVLVPAWSNYEPRSASDMLYDYRDEASHYRTYYLTYDLLPYLQQGKNALGIWLGNGWYHQNRRNVEGRMDYGFPKLALSLTLTDAQGTTQTLTSGDSFLWQESEIQSNNLYFGEQHDLRHHIHDWSMPNCGNDGWKKVSIVEPPQTELTLQTCPPDRVIWRLTPRLVWESDGRRIFDCGENITGVVVLRCPAMPGSMVRIAHSEELCASGDRLDYASTGGETQIQADEYLCGETELLCMPRFCWHGFRYFELSGEAAPATEVEEVRVIHSNIRIASSFECSDPMLNWIYQAYIRTQLSNCHCGVPSDCPHRERLGYTGDGQVTAPAAMLCLDAKEFYRKWMQDIVDSQDRNNGHVQHTAPFYGGGGGPGGWGGAVYLLPMAWYEAYGDTDFLRLYAPAIWKWLSYMHSRSNNGLVVREEEGGWCLGDWSTPGNHPEIPEPFVNTYYYIRGLRAAMKILSLLGEGDEGFEGHGLRWLKEQEQYSVLGMQTAYFNPETGSFCGGVNGADAFAVDLGLGDSRTLDNLIHRYSTSLTLDTGIFGTDLLLSVLFQNGQGELAYRLLSEDTDTSFARMRRNGATTLWEFWDGSDSHNHPMLGAVVRTFFTYILGIRQAEGSGGWQEVTIEPASIPALTWAKGHIETPAGRIFVHWQRNANGVLELLPEKKMD